jgi:hypothetical protein
MHKTTLFPAVLLIFLSLATAANAREIPDGTFRLFIDFARPTGTSEVIGIPVEAHDTTGFGLFYEVRLNHRAGLDIGFIYADFDFQIADMNLTFGSAPVIPIVFGVPVHLLPKKSPVDLYLEPQVSLNIWGDFEDPNSGISGSLELDGGLGAALGLDVPFGKSNWQLNVAVRYLTMGADDGADTIAVDPLFAEIGIGYRF